MKEKRCKHGMIPQCCAYCRKVERIENIKFPIKVNDDGEEKTIWLRREVKRVHYR